MHEGEIDPLSDVILEPFRELADEFRAEWREQQELREREARDVNEAREAIEAKEAPSEASMHGQNRR